MSTARTRLLAVSALCFALVECATPEPAHRLDPSGFLGDYAQLEPGRGDQPPTSTSLPTRTSPTMRACRSIP